MANGQVRVPSSLGWVIALAVAAVVTCLGGLARAQVASADGPVLRVANLSAPVNPALWSARAEGAPEGFLRDLIEAIARAEGMRIEYVNVGASESARGSLMNDRVDLLPVVPINSSSVTLFAPSTSLVMSPVVAFGKWETPVVKTTADLMPLRVVAVEGGPASATLAELGIVHAAVANIEQGFEAVVNDKADYFIETELDGRYAMQHPGTAPPLLGVRILPLLTIDGARLGAEFGVATLKGDPRRILERVNRGLLTVRASGEYASIYKSWLERYQPLRLTTEDASRLLRSGRRWNSGSLRVGVDPALVHPLVAPGTPGQESGFFPEMMRAIAAEMSVKIEFVALSGAELRSQLAEGKIDAIAGAEYLGLDVYRMDFTRPLHATPGVLLMLQETSPPQQTSEFSGITVAAIRDSSGFQWAAASGFNKVVPVDASEDALELLRSRTVDAAVMDAIAARTALGPKESLGDLKMYRLPGEGYLKSYTIAVRAGTKELLWDLEDAMNKLDRSGKRREIERKWLGLGQVRDPSEAVYRWPIITGVISALILIVIAAGFWVTTLRRELSRRTARLQQEEARLKAITESVPAVVYGYLERPDGQRELRYSNRRLEEWSRVFPSLGGSGDLRGFVEAMHPTDVHEFESRLRETGAARRRFQQEVRVQDSDKHYRWIQITLDPDPVSEGVLWHGIMQETTELRLAAEALAQSERNFRQIFEATQDAILVFASGFGRVLEANKAASVLYGYTREELLAMDASELFDHPDDLPTSNDAFAGLVLRHRRKCGGTLDVECSSAIVQYGGRPAMLSVNRDVTSRTRFEEQRRQLESQMMQAQKMESLGLLAGGIAHDFNNLLVGIMGNASLARAQIDDHEGLGQTLDQIVLTTRRASDLTQQLLAYAGKARLSVQNVDLSLVASEMVKLLGTRLSRGARMVFSFAPRSVVTIADPVQIRQIVMNLLTNASDALKGGEGVITIRTGVARFDRLYLSETFVPTDIPEGEYAFLEIADDGCGMDQEAMQRIFDPFYTTKFVGRGLGLSVALSIVQRHHGAIKVFSERDRGTVFRLLLPLAPQASGAVHELKPAFAPPRPRVLLVRAGSPGSEELTRTLVNAGFDVVGVETGAEGVGFLTSGHVFESVVLADPDPHTASRIALVAGSIPCIAVTDLPASSFPELRACFAVGGGAREVVAFLKQPSPAAVGTDSGHTP